MKIFDQGLDHLMNVIADAASEMKSYAERAGELGSSDSYGFVTRILRDLGLTRGDVTGEELQLIRNGLWNVYDELTQKN